MGHSFIDYKKVSILLSAIALCNKVTEHDYREDAHMEAKIK